MGSESDRLYDLRPVTFNWRHDDNDVVSWGLIAEEVHEAMPELVEYDELDLPESVKYEELSVLLVNEVQKLRKRLATIERKLQQNVHHV